MYRLTLFSLTTHCKRLTCFEKEEEEEVAPEKRLCILARWHRDAHRRDGLKIQPSRSRLRVLPFSGKTKVFLCQPLDHRLAFSTVVSSAVRPRGPPEAVLVSEAVDVLVTFSCRRCRCALQPSNA